MSNIPNKNLKIGNIINITNAVLLAPMEGITDLPFRLICKELGADIVYTEFVASEALIRNIPQTFKKIILDIKERPVAVQIFGNDPARMALAAKIVEDEGADFVDVNYGCWVKKVVSHNAGSALMKDPDLMAEITYQCARAVSVPVTIKTRLGWNNDSINICEIARLQEQAGAKAITVHCRTREQKIVGNANWSYIPEIKKNISIPLILNGDVDSPDSALKAMNTEGADAIMIGRAVIGNPFIFRDAKNRINNIDSINPGRAEIIRERIDYCIKHLSYNIEYKGEHGLLEFRKHYSGYLHSLYNAKEVRQKLVIATDFDEIVDLLNDYFDYLMSHVNEEKLLTM